MTPPYFDRGPNGEIVGPIVVRHGTFAELDDVVLASGEVAIVTDGRHPLQVAGDGSSTVAELVTALNLPYVPVISDANDQFWNYYDYPSGNTEEDNGPNPFTVSINFQDFFGNNYNGFVMVRVRVGSGGSMPTVYGPHALYLEDDISFASVNPYNSPITELAVTIDDPVDKVFYSYAGVIGLTITTSGEPDADYHYIFIGLTPAAGYSGLNIDFSRAVFVGYAEQ